MMNSLVSAQREQTKKDQQQWISDLIKKQTNRVILPTSIHSMKKRLRLYLRRKMYKHSLVIERLAEKTWQQVQVRPDHYRQLATLEWSLSKLVRQKLLKDRKQEPKLLWTAMKLAVKVLPRSTSEINRIRRLPTQKKRTTHLGSDSFDQISMQKCFRVILIQT